MAKMHYEFAIYCGIQTINSKGNKVRTKLHNNLERYEVFHKGADYINTIWKNLKIEPQIQFHLALDKFAKYKNNNGIAFIYVNSELDFDKICDLLDKLIKNLRLDLKLNPCICRIYQYNLREFTDYFKIGAYPLCIHYESLEQWQKEQEKSINCSEDYPNYCWN